TPLHSPTPTFTSTPTPTPIYHTVEKGDTLSGLAQTYNVNAAIIRLSNKSTNSLQIGQELLIPASHISPDIPVQIHTITGGDTFDRLAFLYGSTIEDVTAANPGLKPTTLRVGQQVIIPVTAPPVNPAANPRSPQIINPDPTPSRLTNLQQQTLEKTNARRQANGLPPLQADPELAVIALAHAQDMIKRGYFAHVTPEGIDLRTRFAQHGVEANWVGENIQFNMRP
ncbi:MAG: LysM peptidoglycan-binding domain-containing protein, partial [Chloroflexi bacterium]|nr:LysM peptidoglycan-binding domain-containing protein [Chloroflexota bacterium]